MASSHLLAKQSRQRAPCATASRVRVAARSEPQLVSGTIERLLLAASEEFGQKGYEGASIEGVARRAGAGKMTVYRHFGDKHALFHALVQRSASQIQVGLDFMKGDTRAPELVLMDAARRIQEVSLLTANLQLMRMVIGESQRFPELARELLSLHEGSSQPLREYFSGLMQSGEFARRDPDVLARMFFRMTVEAYRALLSTTDARTTRSQSELMRSTIDIFLHGASTQSHRRDRRRTR